MNGDHEWSPRGYLHLTIMGDIDLYQVCLIIHEAILKRKVRDSAATIQKDWPSARQVPMLYEAGHEPSELAAAASNFSPSIPSPSVHLLSCCRTL